MPPGSQVIIGIFAVLLLIAAFKLFSAPLKWAAKITLNTLLGFGCLIVFSFLGGYIGAVPGVNLINSLVVGVLGLPGFAMLVCLTWIFH